MTQDDKIQKYCDLIRTIELQMMYFKDRFGEQPMYVNLGRKEMTTLLIGCSVSLDPVIDREEKISGIPIIKVRDESHLSLGWDFKHERAEPQ